MFKGTVAITLEMSGAEKGAFKVERSSGFNLGMRSVLRKDVIFSGDGWVIVSSSLKLYRDL